MKLLRGDKAVIFLGTGLLILAYISFGRGQRQAGVCWLLGAFGCGVMIYAAKRRH